jgi:hypothetical protein
MGTVPSPAAGPSRRARILRQSIAVVLLAGCGDGGGTGVVPNPHPVITALSPGTIGQGSPAFDLLVSGTDFVPGAVVRWNGSDRPTTRVDPMLLRARIPAADLQALGGVVVTVANPAPGGGTSNQVPFTVVELQNPFPQIVQLQPQSVLVETGGTIRVLGIGFIAGSTVRVGGYSPPVTLVSPTELSFVLGPERVPVAGEAPVVVTNPSPGGGASNPLGLSVRNPSPALASISPAQGTVGENGLTVRLTGTGFVTTSVARFGFDARPTRRISPTELEVDLTAADLGTAGAFPIAVLNPTPGGGVSGPVQLSLVNPVPTASSVTPSSALAAQDSLVVTLTGTGFLPVTEVRLNGTALPTRRISATQVEATLAATDLETPSTISLTAANPAPGGGTTAALPLTLAAPVPSIDMIPANGGSAGRPGFAVQVNGTGFVRTSQGRWNGSPRTTEYVSNRRIDVILTNGDVAVQGTGNVTVSTPGGGTSNGAPIALRTPGAVQVLELRSLDLAARDLAWDEARGRIYASITAGPRANTVVRIDPVTGVIDGEVNVGSSPGRLALSDDGNTLWVGVDGASEVRRVPLPAFTAGAAFSIGFSPADELHAMPGAPGSVAVVREGAITIFDNGVPRGHSGVDANSAVFGGSASVMYGYNNFSSEFGFRTFRVAPDGVTEVRLSTDVIGGYYETLLFAGGRVYSRRGTVVDAPLHRRVGILDTDNPSAFFVDTRLGRAFYLSSGSGTLEVYDVNTFQKLGSAYVGPMNSEHPANSSERLLRWGTDGLAVNDGQQIFLFRSPVAGP